MIYREVGRIRTTYASDQRIFPFNRIALRAIAAKLAAIRHLGPSGAPYGPPAGLSITAIVIGLRVRT